MKSSNGNEDLNPFNEGQDDSNGDNDIYNYKFTTPFTPDQLGPKSTTNDSVNIEVRYPACL